MSASHALLQSPSDTWRHTLAKLCFFVCCVVVAAALVLFSISLTGMRDPSGASLGAAVRKNTSQLGQGLRGALLAAATVTDHITSAVAKATNIHALIRPADYMSTPTITASPTTMPLTISAAPIAAQHIASAQTATVPLARPPAPLTNGYAWGNCTWWAAARRAELGQPIPNNWGNAATWTARASRAGYRVDHTPSPGAIMQTPYSAGGLGHVAIVEQVDPSGSWHISEMNVLGLNIVDHAAKAAATAASYNFIH